MNGTEEVAASAEVVAPVVFQCGCCRRVVSDSNFMGAASAAEGAVTLSAACGLAAGAPLDAGRRELRCCGCDALLGAFDPTRPAELRLSTAALVSYQLGSCRGAAVLPARSSSSSSSSSSAAARDDGAAARLSELAVDSTLLKEALIAMDARTTRLEELVERLRAKAADGRKRGRPPPSEKGARKQSGRKRARRASSSRDGGGASSPSSASSTPDDGGSK